MTCLPAEGDHVQIGVVALAEFECAAVLAHTQAAEQPKGDALGARRVDEPAALVQHVATDSLRGRWR